MSRPLRIEFPGGLYHITSRGNEQKSIFLNPRDRLVFLDLLDDVVRKYHVICHAYCLMDNHYHLLIETPEANVSKSMRQLNGVYTQRFNRSRNRRGHLFQGRFTARIVDHDAYLISVARYIVVNPIRTKTVSKPGSWPWSSYNATAGSGPRPGFLATDFILSMFCDDRQNAQQQYQEFVNAGFCHELWKELRSRIFLGGADFVARVSEMIDCSTRVQEFSREERFAGRPELQHLLDTTSSGTRDEFVVQACMRYGYSQREIGDFLGVHYSSISRIVNRELARMKRHSDPGLCADYTDSRIKT
jgi:putative transposase